MMTHARWMMRTGTRSTPFAFPFALPGAIALHTPATRHAPPPLSPALLLHGRRRRSRRCRGQACHRGCCFRRGAQNAGSIGVPLLGRPEGRKLWFRLHSRRARRGLPVVESFLLLPLTVAHTTTTAHAAFGCFMRSVAPDKGTDCADAFLALQAREHYFSGTLPTCVTHAYCPVARRRVCQDTQTSMLP